MAVSSDVVAGTAATAAQYNALRDDVIDVTNGHDHSGSVDTGKYIGVVPIGGIIMWSGSAASVPTHWQVCDGTNGTPDLRDRFVIGAGNSYAVNASGGATTKNVSHTHTMSFNSGSEAAHTHGATGLTTSNAGANHTHMPSNLGSVAQGYDFVAWIVNAPSNTGSADHTHNMSGNTAVGSSHLHAVSGTSASGGSATQDIMPPYYALCFIQRLS